MNIFFKNNWWKLLGIILILYSIIAGLLIDVPDIMGNIGESIRNLFFGVLGIITGMEWANFTWGTPWTNDPQLNGAAISILAYFAYVVLRRSIDEENKRARISAVYNIFAFVMLIVFIGILPKLSSGSLHPGAGGSESTVNSLDSTMRLVFYPAIAGWIIIGFWLIGIRVKMAYIRQHLDNPE